MELITLGELSLAGSQFRGAKPLLLLAYLALEGTRSRRHVAELFWPSAENPLNSLSAALKQLRQGAPGSVEADPTHLWCTVSCDAQAALAAVEGREYKRMEALYRGPFLRDLHLPGWSAELEEWVYSTREFIGARVRGALLESAEREAETGSLEAAALHASAAYRLPGAAEPDAGEVRRLYTLFAAASHPDASTLRREAEAYGVALPPPEAEGAKTALQPPPRTPHNLPLRSTSFVGRALERRRMRACFDNPACRLVTLTGPGGVGKTRLALSTAFEFVRNGRFSGGVYFVELSALSAAQGVPNRIAEALGLVLRGSGDPLTQIANHLGNGLADTGLASTGLANSSGAAPVLLVLDNFEHLMEAAALPGSLLERLPSLKLLVTSRERLRLEEEEVMLLDGLSHPNPSGGGENEQPSDGWAFDAVQLFVERAKRLHPGLSLRQGDLPQLLRICHLVGGSPLGLELAAAWVRVMSCEEIAREIERDLGFLTSSLRNIPERHRSVRSALEPSWRLLTPKEREVYTRLAVFRGGFSREAAAEVAGATIPVLASLVDKSLLRLEDKGRYGRHPLLYSYAYEKLREAPESYRAVRRAHARHFLAFAERAEPELAGPQLSAWLERLSLEHDNLRAALAWTREEDGELETGLRLAGALLRFWEARGHLREGRESLERLLAHPNSDAYPAACARALYSAGRLAWAQSDYDAAHTLSAKSLGLYRQLGDQGGVGAALNTLGIVAHDRCDYTLARTLHEEALALRRALGDARGVAISLSNLGIAAHEQGELAESRALHEEGLAVMRTLHDPQGTALLLTNLGIVLCDQGEYAPSRTRMQEGLKLWQELGDQRGAAFLLEGFAALAAAQKEARRAAQLWGAASTLRARIGAPLPPSEQGRFERAKSAAQNHLNEAAFEAAWAVGAAMTLVSAVAYALREAPRIEGSGA